MYEMEEHLVFSRNVFVLIVILWMNFKGVW